MAQRSVAVGGQSEDGFVVFSASGDHADGDFRCAECGYGVAIASTTLPDCPMCRGSVWELSGHATLGAAAPGEPAAGLDGL